MKKILLLLVLVAAISPAIAQNCTADTTITETGIYPEYLDTAELNQPYEHIFQVLSIKDTVVNFQGNMILAEIDSIKIVDIKGLPNSFDYLCEPTNCVFTWEKVGCVKLEGNPTSAESGVHPLEIITTSYARWGLLRLPVNDTITDYTLVVGDGAASIYTPSKEKVSVYPNPAQNGIFYISSNTTIQQFQLVDLQGKEVDFSVSENNNTWTIDISRTPRGIYFVSFKTGSRLVKKRIIH